MVEQQRFFALKGGKGSSSTSGDLRHAQFQPLDCLDAYAVRESVSSCRGRNTRQKITRLFSLNMREVTEARVGKKKEKKRKDNAWEKNVQGKKVPVIILVWGGGGGDQIGNGLKISKAVLPG